MTGPTCDYCEETDGLRVACDGGGFIAPSSMCQSCFTPRDDGPSFDDLPALVINSGVMP